MASSNINKIVRSNLKLKPWIASKNTNEIVNSYVQKFYKQIPNDIKSDLMKSALIGAQKTENRFFARKIIPEKFTIPIITGTPTSKLRSNGYRSPAITTKNSFVNNSPKKLLKTPNFKIYSRRRYTSSVASSKSSFGRNKTQKNEEFRKKIYAAPGPVELPSFRGVDFFPNKKIFNNDGLTTMLHSPKRMFNEPNPTFKVTEFSKSVVANLMAVNESVKKKICVVKPKFNNAVEPLEIKNTNVFESSFKGWNHPSLEHFHKLTTKPMIKKPDRQTRQGSFHSAHSSFRLMPVKRKPFSATARKNNPKAQFQYATSFANKANNPAQRPAAKDLIPPKMPAKRPSVKEIVHPKTPLGFAAFDRINLKNRTIDPVPDSPNEKQDTTKSNRNNKHLDFVCLSNAERRERKRSQQEIQRL